MSPAMTPATAPATTPASAATLAIGMLIGGKDRPALSGRTFVRTGPLEGTVATRAAAADPADARAAAD
ncbi:hypothetical protein MTR62_20615, partial [Novosphingobium sp. 1949]